MTQNILNENIARILGIESMSVEEQAVFLSEIGDVIFETSLLRLVAALSEDEQQSLEQYVHTEPEPEVLLAYLLENYPAFATILEVVVLEYKEIALQALKQKEKDIQIIE